MSNAIWTVVLLHAVAFHFDDDKSLEIKVGEVFSRSCVSCHNANDQAGGLSLETADDLRSGGYLELDAETQPLLAVLTQHAGQPPSMPKDGKPLADEQLTLIHSWLSAGAPWSVDHRVGPAIIDDYQWWSRAPLVELLPPDINNLSPLTRDTSDPPFDSPLAALSPHTWVKNPIDQFMWQEFERRGLAPSPEADRRTLIRRLSYDLTGLPPTRAEIEAFENDTDPLAYEQLVERLLASPRYGERFARHWLDIARYADTAGYDKDKLRPQAWPYRDYVIRSFNEDKPYNRFIEEQLAGDVLYPDTADGIMGLGFLAAGPWDFIGHVEVPESKFDGMEARNLDRDEMVSATMNVFCSTTVQCARCHHHKFDPITMPQYYGLQAVFAAVDRANRSYDMDEQTATTRRRLSRELSETGDRLTELEAQIEAEGGQHLRDLRAKVQELESAMNRPIPTQWPDAYGYHSQLSESPTEEKWVEFHFAKPVDLTRVVIHPCHDDFGGIGVGFGFPSQLTLSVRGLESEEWQVWTETSDTDASRMKHEPWQFAATAPRSIQSLRIAASQLAWRQDAWIMALAEVELWTLEENVAAQATLAAKDSIEAPPRWRLENLIDGLWPQYATTALLAEPNRAEQLRAAKTELVVVEDPLWTPARAAAKRDLKTTRQRLEQELAALPPPDMVFAAATHFSTEGNFRATQGVPRPVKVLHRGSVAQPLEDAVPGTIPLSPDDPFQFRHPELESQDGWRRAQLATWITNPDHPLTWRSIVNRVWLWHFGRAIVDSPNDFGRMGQLPTHPELLDWMAAQFRSQPSFKNLSRLIVTSATYRQASQDHPRFQKLDADNSGYWTFSRRRLSAEEVRDSMLMVAGCLNETMGGPGFYLFQIDRPEHSPHFEYDKADPNDPATHRRSIYRFVVRSQPDPWITTMDGADCSQSVAKRDETITPMQALSLLNNDFTLMIARRLAERLEAEASDRAAQVRLGFERVCGRAPTEFEQQTLRKYADEFGLENLCRVLVNLSEFVFVD
jgi:hypothetical protein